MKLEGVLNNIVFELGKYIENCYPRSTLKIFDIIKIGLVSMNVALDKTVK